MLPVLDILANEKKEFKAFMLSRFRGMASTNRGVKEALRSAVGSGKLNWNLMSTGGVSGRYDCRNTYKPVHQFYLTQKWIL